MRFTSWLTPRVSSIPAKRLEFYASKSGSDARIESLRSFQLAFIDEFAAPGKRFNAVAFEAKVDEGNVKFQQTVADEKSTTRRPVLIDLKEQFDADAVHLPSKASCGKVTPALASEMKKDTNKIYDHALGAGRTRHGKSSRKNSHNRRGQNFIEATQG
jgi:hypothetical protein